MEELACEKDTNESIVKAKVDWRAWSAVLGGFLALHGGAGVQYAYGEWQVYYETTAYPTTSIALLSFVGSFQVLWTDGACLFAGLAGDRYGPRAVTLTGTALMVVPHILLAFSSSLWQVFLLQGVAVGIGEACMHISGLTVPALWLPKHRGLVIGCAGLGMATAPIAWPLLFHALLQRYGFRWANIGVALCLLCVDLAATYLLRLPPAHRQPVSSQVAARAKTKAVWRQLLVPGYLLTCFAKSLGWFGLSSILFYLPTLALYTTSSSLRVYILPISMACQLPGRVAGGLFADRIGILNGFCCCLALFAAACWSTWLPATDKNTTLLCAILIGLTSGAWNATADAAVSKTGHDMDIAPGLAMGAGIFTHLYVVASAPLGGLLVQSDARHPFLRPVAFWASALTLAVALSIIANVLHRREVARRAALDMEGHDDM